MPNDYLYTIAQEILSTTVDILVDAGLEVPDRTFVTFGEVPDDCNLLAVAWQSLYTGDAGAPNNQPEGQGFVNRAATFEIRRIRCIVSADERGTPPAPIDINEDAELLLTDLWAIYQGFVARKGDRTFLTACEGFTLGNAVPVGPSGGVGGWVLPVDVQVL